VSSRVYFVKAKAEHIDLIAPRLRAEDEAEVLVAGASDGRYALADSFKHSRSAFTVMIDDKPEGMFGCCSVAILTSIGAPWFLGTDALRAHPMAMVRGGREVVQFYLRRYRVLRNVVDVRYCTALRWAALIGFTVGQPLPIGKDGALLVPIEARS
jgi:hypothetical protein